MVVTLDEMKKYLRVDFEDDDTLLRNIMESAQTLCMDVARITDEDVFEEVYFTGKNRKGFGSSADQ